MDAPLKIAEILRALSRHEVEFIVLDVETLIETKEFAGRPKDQNGLLYLRQLLAEIKQSAVAEGNSSDRAP